MFESEETKHLVSGGSWNNRHPSFFKETRSLFRRSFLNKIRDKGVIASEIIATVIISILAVFWNFANNPHEAVTETKFLNASELFGNIVLIYNQMYTMGKGGNYVAGPSNSKTLRSLISKTWGATKLPVLDYEKYEKTKSIILSLKRLVNVSREFVYVREYKRIIERINENEAFSVGIWWDNADDETYWSNLTAHIFESQTNFFTYHINVDFMALLAYETVGEKLKTTNAKLNDVLTDYINNMDVNQSEKDYLQEHMKFWPYQNSSEGFKLPNIMTSKMHRPKVTNQLQIDVVVALFSAIPIVIASLPDLSLVLNDKESHMMTFLYIMGATETSYWLVNNISTFCMCFVPYLVIDILFSTWLCMAGTDFSLLFVLSMLFILSYIQFQNFFSTFFNKASGARILTVIFLISCIFFSYMNSVYTLTGPKVTKHLFSLIPFVSYQLSIAVMYEEVRLNRPPIGWKDIKEEKYRYPIYYSFIWLPIDFVLWGLLFLFFNAVNDREFGNQPLKLKNLFKKKQTNLHDLEGDKIIVAEDVMKRYPKSDKNAIDVVSFGVSRGEIIVMIGPNGAGKSSILNVLSGSIPLTNGKIYLEDSSYGKTNKNLGIVFQDNVIYKHLSIREHLEIFGRIRGLDEQVLQESIDFFCDNLQLKEMLPNRAGDLSGGQKRKLCIAMSLLGNPPIIMMDEPTAGVDVQARQLIWKSISNLKNSTCIITTHALEEAEAVSSRIFVVSKGKIPFIGTSTELRSKFKCGYNISFVCEKSRMDDIFEEIKKFAPDAVMNEEKENSVMVPVTSKISDLLIYLDDNDEKLGIERYTFTIEQLEDTLLRIIESN
ncbi:ABC transporter family protein [Trichomonas vaginalis G3]|uniref:ABC transporter family protein n=1 Tax=Trichomonas vaginalis (strain ATCC PRA-98 / G3) TaxID=412133 RepID=A2F1K6_TRIV3|nr:ATPase activity, coupled to transmembrane movement of substances [Trichomonas vaginalis G3]EAY01224.1 ABC transporter family protein [Trichomonas vaginalis G3]KAI5532496.1 ATPase activity, coupled to transmembrane movement of substances [Trichomonas vaginalis G3]|eukprot:XP_001330140.1 ABC transporter family protein [Trichomonas vaginalis G3]